MRSALSWLSLTTAPIELFASDGTSCGRASGFFYSHDCTHVYYVTNWHVLTGKDPSKPRMVGHNWKVPIEAKLRLHSKTGRDGAISLADKLECSIAINDKTGDAPEWLEHPKHGRNADVAVLKVSKADLDTAVIYKTISECDLSPEYRESVMDDIYVIGYPWGLDGGDGVLPLYKRGSIASEPAIDQQGLPRFLVDCRTATSMSGSPVVCSHSGVWMPNGQMDDQSIIGTTKKFVGVYSGRLIERGATDGQEPAATEIGQVWRQEVIDEIVMANQSGKALSES